MTQCCAAAIWNPVSAAHAETDLYLLCFRRAAALPAVVVLFLFRFVRAPVETASGAVTSEFFSAPIRQWDLDQVLLRPVVRLLQTLAACGARELPSPCLSTARARLEIAPRRNLLRMKKMRQMISRTILELPLQPFAVSIRKELKVLAIRLITLSRLIWTLPQAAALSVVSVKFLAKAMAKCCE